MDFMEGALLKMKKGFTGANWKKNWVYADHENFYQWQIGTKPTNGEAPKYTFDLTECKVEESQLKKFAFKITDPNDGTVAVYAADDFDTYEKWIKVLFGNSEFKESATTEERSDMVSNYSEDFKQFASDAIADFFFSRDPTKESRDPVIEEKDLRRLLHTLDASLNVTTTAHMIMRDLKIKPSGTISRSSFQEWWSNNQKYFHSGPIAVEDAAPSDMRDRILYAGFLDTHIVNGLGAKNEFLFKSRIPKYTTVEGFDAPVYEDVEDWNTLYQECREQASIAQSHAPYSLDYTPSEEVWSNYRIPPSGLSEAGDDATATNTEPEAQVETSNRFSMEEAVHSCLTLAAFKGSFNQLAREGAQIIVDELTLPENMKNARRVPKESQLAIQTQSGADSEEDLYEYGGIVFRVVACDALDVDRKPGAARNAQLSNTEELLHKTAGAEQQSSHALEQAIESVYSEYQMREHWHHLRHPHDKLQQQQPQGSPQTKDPKKKFEHLLRPCTLLSTVVDYAGYRLVALCPLHIMEQFSLLHGYVEHPQTETEPRNKHSASSDAGSATDEGTAEDEVRVDEDPDDLFVNALPAYRSILPQLAAKLNVKLMKRKLSVCTSSLFSAEESNKALSNVEILTEELQAHKGMDDRLYVLNTHGLLPNDLARDDTADPLTRYLRPEFVCAYRQSLPTDGFTLKKYLHRDQVDLDNEEDCTEAEKKAALDSAAELIEACASLYKVQIPHVARLLDSLSEMTPTDSFSLTRVLHSYGINMRHIGLIYPLCKTPCVRQTLLIEAIARSCKVILKQTLRRLSRKCQAESLMALHRGRSKNNDFVELMDASCAKRKDAVLDLFNTVFASHCNIAASDEFWNGILSEVVFRKFGIDLRVAVGNNRLAMLHFPQLFAALQYHTECRFKDITYTHHFGGTAVLPSAVFTVDHLSQVFIASSDLPLHIPGELGLVAANAEAFLLNGVLSEAINAFQLKLTMLTQLFKADEKGTVLSFPQQAQYSETLYKLALCLYKNKQYSESRSLLRRYISRYPQYTVVAGRLFTLLMCVEFKSGCYDKARVYFDAAQCIYNYTLSIHHPIAALHMCTMSDLYKEVGCLAQAKALLLLAHTASRKALGEYHMVNAMYENKLAVLHMLEGNFKEATVLLSNCLTVYDLMTNSGANLDHEMIDCLHSLTDAFAMCEEIDLAIHSGFRCVELCAKSGTNHTVHVSVLLILSDLFVQKHELESAFELLHESWTNIRSLASTTVGGVVGQALARLSAKILELLISTLPMQTRSLFESVAEDVLMPKSDGTTTEGLDQESWSRACDAVLEAIWTNKPYDYFLVVLQGIQHHEIGGKGATKKLRKDLVDSNNKAVSFPVQAAVLAKLLQNPMSFSQRLISF